MPRRATVLALVLALPGLVATCGSERPDRVLLVGDSLMNQTAGPLRQDLPAAIDVRNEAVNGSGLLTPWYFDWERHLPRVLDAFDPDTVVLLFIGNYDFGDGRYAALPDGTPVEDRTSEEFFRSWGRAAERLTAAAAADAEVVWALLASVGRPAG